MNRVNGLLIGVHVSFWLLNAFSFFLFYQLFVPVRESLEAIAVHFCLIIPFAYLVAGMIQFWVPKKRYLILIMGILGALALFTWLRVMALTVTEIPNLFGNKGSMPSILWSRMLGTNALYGLFSIAFGLLRVQQAEVFRLRKAESAQKEAEIRFLKGQMNPHFLFNSLNNIYSLAVAQKPEAAEMVLQLSDLLRYVIYESRKPQVSLRQEVEQIEKYIHLYQLKSESPLPINFTWKGDIAHWQLEPLILLPIVENCFKHGDFDFYPAGFIRLHLEVKGEELTFTAINTYSRRHQAKDHASGVGLENIQRRLALKYPDRYTLKTRREANVFSLTLTIHRAHD